MTKKRRAFEHGHTRKLLGIVDEAPEVYCALFYAAGRVQQAGGRVQLLCVIEPEDQFWEGVRQARMLSEAKDPVRVAELRTAISAHAVAKTSVSTAWSLLSCPRV